MKLLFCEDCQDVFRLTQEERVCGCGETKGRYLEDGLHAEYSGDCAVPLFIGNHSLRLALAARPKEGKGSLFTAGVIPEICDTMVKRDE